MKILIQIMIVGVIRSSRDRKVRKWRRQLVLAVLKACNLLEDTEHLKGLAREAFGDARKSGCDGEQEVSDVRENPDLAQSSLSRSRKRKRKMVKAGCPSLTQILAVLLLWELMGRWWWFLQGLPWAPQ